MPASLASLQTWRGFGPAATAPAIAIARGGAYDRPPRHHPASLAMSPAPAIPALPEESLPGAERPFLAIGMVLLAVALFSVMDALSKLMATHFDPVELVWGRYLAILALLAPLLLREPRLLSAARPGLQLLRGVCVLGAAVFFIAGLARLARPTPRRSLSPRRCW